MDYCCFYNLPCLCHTIFDVHIRSGDKKMYLYQRHTKFVFLNLFHLMATI